MTRAAISLGANLGEPRVALRGAVAGLEQHPSVHVLAVSGLWRTSAVGGPAQPDFVNAVVLLDTTLDARELLSLAHDLEDAAGRVRAERWGPRTLDVDLIEVGDQRSDEPALTLPHPRAHVRAFVLAPWAQVDPHHVLAPAGQPAATVAHWAQAVVDQEVELVEGGTWWR
jgi:2-amino-4-hydroxy-6-hydroxymethyldihydropteridine diphosphokinase